jgi:hypothetical protein
MRRHESIEIARVQAIHAEQEHVPRAVLIVIVVAIGTQHGRERRDAGQRQDRRLQSSTHH